MVKYCIALAYSKILYRFGIILNTTSQGSLLPRPFHTEAESVHPCHSFVKIGENSPRNLSEASFPQNQSIRHSVSEYKCPFWHRWMDRRALALAVTQVVALARIISTPPLQTDSTTQIVKPLPLRPLPHSTTLVIVLPPSHKRTYSVPQVWLFS